MGPRTEGFAAYVQAVRKRLAARHFTQPFRLFKHPRRQDGWTTWIEYLSYAGPARHVHEARGTTLSQGVGEAGEPRLVAVLGAQQAIPFGKHTKSIFKHVMEPDLHPSMVRSFTLPVRDSLTYSQRMERREHLKGKHQK